MKFLNVILILTISALALGACAAPKIVVPEIARPGYEELVRNQPDCTPFIEELEGQVNPTHEAVLAALWCYRGVWKYWEAEYEELDAQIRAVEEGAR